MYLWWIWRVHFICVVVCPLPRRPACSAETKLTKIYIDMSDDSVRSVYWATYVSSMPFCKCVAIEACRCGALHVQRNMHRDISRKTTLEKSMRPRRCSSKCRDGESSYVGFHICGTRVLNLFMSSPLEGL